ncbi:MAG: hypothetical protein N2V75_10670 [Methanophagales archaeon]|nr:hypothetical protein [Methanophagales archaeon]
MKMNPEELAMLLEEGEGYKIELKPEGIRNEKSKQDLEGYENGKARDI